MASNCGAAQAKSMLGTQMEQTEGHTGSELERKRGRITVQELMLTTDVYHSYLIAVTL